MEPKERAPLAESAASLSDAELTAMCEEYWRSGGARFMGVVGDALIDPQANERLAEFVRRKIRATVKDPETAAALCPTNHPIGTRRICVDIDYFETYNRPNVRLVNLLQHPIARITRDGVQLSDEHVALDTLVLATGFDAMTGALGRIDIRGTGGTSLKEQWSEGPRTYLGLMVQGFPNLFTITGPGSPSVLSNMLVSIEQHVDFVMDLLHKMRSEGFARVEAEQAAQDAWVAHVNDVANATLFQPAAPGTWAPTSRASPGCSCPMRRASVRIERSATRSPQTVTAGLRSQADKRAARPCRHWRAADRGHRRGPPPERHHRGSPRIFPGGRVVALVGGGGSIIATLVSSVTFVSVPAAVFRDGGNLGYFQLIVGLALGKVVVAMLLARAYYESQGVASTYEYIGARMDRPTGEFSMLLGLLLGIINSGVKLLTASLVLDVVSGWGLSSARQSSLRWACCGACWRASRPSSGPTF